MPDQIAPEYKEADRRALGWRPLVRYHYGIKELDFRHGSIRIDTRFRTGTLIARGNGGPD
jgi:hypothetical protein